MTNRSDIPAIYLKYPQDILDGKIVACKWVKLACQRFFDWLDRDDIYFDWKAAERVEKFANLFTLSIDNYKKKFELLPFQRFLLQNIFGWKKLDGNRLINKVYFEVARKNAKSMLAALINAYMLLADGDGQPECYTIANSASQAALCFNMTSKLLKQIDPRGKHLKFLRDTIRSDIGLLRVLSSDTSKLDGLNASCAIVDEFHAAPTNEVYSILRTSQAMRIQPLMIVITTPGYLLDGACKAMRDTCCNILQGNIHDDTQLALMYELDEGDDYRDEEVWIKANPSIGDIVRVEYLREQVKEAQNNPANETSVKTKNFSVWCASNEVWLSNETIQKSMLKLDDGFFDGKVVYCGLDLASVSDLTALATMTYDEEEDKYYFKVKYYLPSDTVENSPNRELYKHWAKKGYLTVLEGNVTDYDYILNDLLKLSEKSMIAQLSYDKWNSVQLIIKAESEHGLPCKPVSQSIGAMNFPTKELTRLILSDKVVIDYNPITRWCFANSALKTDVNENTKVVKGGSPSQKIDGVIAIIQALTPCIVQPQSTTEIVALDW